MAICIANAYVMKSMTNFDFDPAEMAKFVDDYARDNPEAFAEFSKEMEYNMKNCENREEEICKLPKEDTVWLIVEQPTMLLVQDQCTVLKDCQTRDWKRTDEFKEHGHKKWCKLIKSYIAKTDELSTFPFTFTKDNILFSKVIKDVCDKFSSFKGQIEIDGERSEAGKHKQYMKLIGFNLVEELNKILMSRRDIEG
ncbi:hypothetical protein LOTGIDRAFT_152249 [Lottia gigantea]|uniref:Uncharacterized protein n=1 Tax=Lottia gigantea TaxID=225164 RepID=V4AMJ7_LOTGI|nr:hypothetical protein LOTGIDRAFT_152249 [Lottia gigantea]ESP05399.1 hypothetical protein LOTGIDRAFT_152249 [Lottia gigantea]